MLNIIWWKKQLFYRFITHVHVVSFWWFWTSDELTLESLESILEKARSTDVRIHHLYSDFNTKEKCKSEVLHLHFISIILNWRCRMIWSGEDRLDWTIHEQVWNRLKDRNKSILSVLVPFFWNPVHFPKFKRYFDYIAKQSSSSSHSLGRPCP